MLEKYNSKKEIFEKLKLEFKENSRYVHTGILDIDELEKELLSEGFKLDASFSLYVDLVFFEKESFRNKIMEIVHE